MPRAIRSLRLPCLGFFVLAAVSGAWAANSGSASSDPGDDAAKKAALVEAIDACDRGAAIPLDPEAKAAPVQFGELLLSDVKKERRRELSRKCQQAALGAPQEKRLQLQWLRVQVSLDEPGLLWLIPQIKAFADSGSAEANYLLFQIFQRHRTDADTSLLVISREAALDALQAAAQPGHLDALQMLLQQYRGGPLLRRDARKAVETAARIMNAPQQGLTPTEHDVKMRSFMPYTIAIVTLEGEGFTAEEQQKAFAVIEAKVNSASSSIGATLVYLSALRFGKGAAQDAVKARQLLEARAADDEEFVPMLADMVAKGEGGPADGKRAIAMLRDDRLKYVFTCRTRAGRAAAGWKDRGTPAPRGHPGLAALLRSGRKHSRSRPACRLSPAGRTRTESCQEIERCRRSRRTRRGLGAGAAAAVAAIRNFAMKTARAPS